MSSSGYYLTVKQLFTESVIGYLVLFTLLFLLTLAQNWINIFLFIFPIITFSFALFFKLIDVNKWRTQFEGSPIVYNPLGSEKNNANRFNVISLLLMIFLMWTGYESIVHPQLIQSYTLFFMLIYFFLYTFSFFILFFDMWKYSQIKLSYEKKGNKKNKEVENYEKIIRFLKIKKFRIISYLNITFFILLNLLNLLFSFLTYFKIIPGYSLTLPGTGLENSKPLILPYTFFIGLILPPFYATVFLLFIYKDINQLRIEDLEDIIKDFSKNMRILILENFQILNKNLLKDLDMDEFMKTMELRESFREYVTRRRAKSMSSNNSKASTVKRKNESVKKEKAKIREINDLKEKRSKEHKSEKMAHTQEEILEMQPEKEEIVGYTEERNKAKEKVKQIRKSIREEADKSKEYHNKNKEHKEWVKKQAASSILTVPKTIGRRTCPNCKEDRKEMIHESIDKTNIIMSSPRVYGKKYKCGRCGVEWREAGEPRED
ncbi:MAG: hypothetical protein EU541_01410 [Promethearchaeota archaeon]|nr:MAG: hypothetical protein EU541_01410 [Candidatus Lokiarchaeota archaeon]